jgi:hypothetical protein
MKEPFPNQVSPELLDKIRHRYSPKSRPPEARPVRVVKKTSGRGKNEATADSKEKG